MTKIKAVTDYGTTPFGKSSYRPEIDGLRAVAVVAVIINHFNKDILPSGYLGVDIFFVISGFVITSSLANHRSESFKDFFLGFYARRVKRLIPALALFAVIVSILICLFNPDPRMSLRTGIASLFGFSNLYLLKQSTDYFATSTELNVFTHTWSLGVEEQYYVLFPLLVWFSGFGRLTAKSERNLFWAAGVLSVASLISFIYLYPTNQPAAYFLMPSRFWELGAGCLLFLAIKHARGLRRALEAVPPLWVAAGILGVLFIPLEFAMLATVAVVLLTVVLIASLRAGSAGYSLFTNRQVVYIGLISYSLYLWHWGVLSISRWTIGIHWWSVPFQTALMLLLAAASYRYVETPLRRSDWSAFRWQTIAYGIGASASAAVVIVGLGGPLKQPLKSISDVYNRHYPGVYANPGIIQKTLYCDRPKNANSAFADCLKATDLTKRTIYIIGDSHASNLYPSIKGGIQALLKFQARFLIDWGLINSLEGNETCGSYSPCIQNSWQKHLDFFRDELRPGDLVIFSWFRDRVVHAGHMPRKANKNKLEILGAKLQSIADLTHAKNASLILVDDIPRTCDINVVFEYTILRMGFLDACSQSKKISKEDRKGMTQLYRSLALEKPGVYLADFHDDLCTSQECGILIPGTQELMYGDTIGHFTPAHPKPLAKQWQAFLMKFNSANY